MPCLFFVFSIGHRLPCVLRFYHPVCSETPAIHPKMHSSRNQRPVSLYHISGSIYLSCEIKCSNNPRHPSVTSCQVASKSRVYHGSATSRPLPANSISLKIFPSGSFPNQRFMFRILASSMPIR